MHIDHVIYAATDLDATTARLGRELGLAAVGGGRHEGHGTENRIIPLDAVAQRLGTPIIALRRAGLSARLTGVADAMREPLLPFFVSRDPGVADPGASSAGGGITALELSGEAARLERWLDGAQLPVRVSEGAPALRAVEIGGRG